MFELGKKAKIRINSSLLVLLVMLSLGLTACAESSTPTPNPIVPGATATVAQATPVPATTSAPSQTTSAAPTLATSTPLATVTIVASTSTTAATTSIPATSAAATTSAVAATTAASTTAVAAPAQLAYVDDYSLVVMNVSTKDKRKLVDSSTTNLGIIGNPAWSGDNKTLAFAASTSPKTPNSRSSIYLIPASGGTVIPLIGNQPANSSDYEPLWSPDGTTIMFTRGLAVNGQFDSQRSKHEIWLVDANGQNPRKLANGKQPIWSSDSLRVAFVTDGTIKPGGSDFPENNALKLINSKGQNEWEPLNTAKIPSDFSKFNYPFSGEARIIQYPAFVDGGKTLAFTTIGATGLVLSINSLNGSELKLWNGQHEGGYARTYAQPKAGSLLIFEGLPPTGYRSFSVVDMSKAPAPDKPVLQSFGGPSRGEALFPVWSSDGTQIAYLAASNSPTIGLEGPVNGTIMLAKIGAGTPIELAKGLISGMAWGR